MFESPGSPVTLVVRISSFKVLLDLPENADSVSAASDTHPSFSVHPAPPHDSVEIYGARLIEAQACRCLRRADLRVCKKCNMLWSVQ